MADIEMHEASAEFRELWSAAGKHLSAQVQGGIQSWLRAHLTPPFLEHLSFRLGNQLFFVRVEDVDRRIVGPGNRNGLLSVASGCKGHACVLPMRRMGGPRGWQPTEQAWGLVNAKTGDRVDPFSLVTDERIEVTDWELQDFAVQVVRDALSTQRRTLMSWQSNPAVDPSLWFVGELNEPEWVIVRAARFPANLAERPANLADIASRCGRTGHIGHFASVAFASDDQPFEREGETVVPLWRGHGTIVKFDGLAQLA